jgi:ABC-type sugar transport system ATPase subunit
MSAPATRSTPRCAHSQEVVRLADRAVVMSRGRVVAELAGADVTTTALTDAAGG